MLNRDFSEMQEIKSQPCITFSQLISKFLSLQTHNCKNTSFKFFGSRKIDFITKTQYRQQFAQKMFSYIFEIMYGITSIRNTLL